MTVAKNRHIKQEGEQVNHLGSSGFHKLRSALAQVLGTGREAVASVAVAPVCQGSGASPGAAVKAKALAVASSLAVAAVASLAIAPAASAGGLIGGFLGGFSGAAEGRYTQPRDVAVYEGTDGDPETDKIFVVEGIAPASPNNNNNRVQRLDTHGNFERSWGRDVATAGSPGDIGQGYEICAADCQAGLSGAAKGEFTVSSGIAVDQANGWVYVMDRSNARVQKFDLDGNFILMFGSGVNQTTGGDVCTQASGDICKAGVGGAGAGQLASIASTGTGIPSTVFPRLAVSPATGDVFATDPVNRRTLQYDSAGAFVRAWGYGVDTGAAQFQVCTMTSTCQVGNAAGLANGQVANNNPIGVAVDSQGVVYLTDQASGTSANRIIRFDADAAPVCAAPADSPCDATAALLGLINPTGAGGPLLATTTASMGIEIDLDSDGAGPDEESLLAVRDPNTPSTADTVLQELDIPTEAGELAGDPVTVVDTHTFANQPLNGSPGVNGSTGNVYLPIALGSPPFTACGATCQGVVVLTGVGAPPAMIVTCTASAVRLCRRRSPGLTPTAFTACDSWSRSTPA